MGLRRQRATGSVAAVAVVACAAAGLAGLPAAAAASPDTDTAPHDRDSSMFASASIDIEGNLFRLPSELDGNGERRVAAVLVSAALRRRQAVSGVTPSHRRLTTTRGLAMTQYHTYHSLGL